MSSAAGSGNRKSNVTIIGSVESESLQFLQKTISRAECHTELRFLLSQREYRAGHSRGGIHRVILRLQLTLGFAIWFLWSLLTNPPRGTVVVTTNPFFAPLLVALLTRRGTAVVQLLYDLYPDAIEAVNPRLSRFKTLGIGAITRATQRAVDGTVYLGKVLRQHTESRWGAAKKSAVIDVGCDEAYFESLALAAARPALTFPLEIHLGGQLGHMHDIPGLAIALKLAFTTDPEIARHYFVACYGSGPLLNELRSICSTIPLSIAPPSPDWPQIVSRASLGLVSLSPAGATVCLPSRVYSLLAGGLAVIAICPRWSDLGVLISEHKVGWVINNSPFESYAELAGDGVAERRMQQRKPEEISAELQRLLRHLADHPEEINERRSNAAALASTEFSTTPLSVRWNHFLATVTR